MSSLNCPTCNVRLWDKDLGNLKKSIQIDGNFYCIKCSHKKEKEAVIIDETDIFDGKSYEEIMENYKE